MDLTTATWRKSRRSQGGGTECVELAAVPGAVAIRDSKDPNGPVHVITTQAFRDLIARVKRGDLDL